MRSRPCITLRCPSREELAPEELAYFEGEALRCEVWGRKTAGFFKDRDVAGWRERRIAALPTEGIGFVDAARTDGRYTLARADSGQWTIDGAAADSAAVMRVVGSFRDLQSAGFPTEEQERDSVDFTDPYRMLTVRSADGDTLLALVFDSTDTGAWARRAGGGPVYRMDRWRVDALLPADSTLRARDGP